MKIIFLSDAVYPYNKGGKEKKIFELSTRLARKGHDVHIYCMKWWKTNEKERKENGVWLHAISPYYPLYSGQRRSIKQGIMFSLHALKLMKVNFDVLDVDHMPFFPLFAAKIVCVLRRKKMAATWHEVWGKRYWLEYMKGPLGLFGYIVEQISFRLPDIFLASSEFTYNRLVNEIKVKQPVFTISNGIDTSKIEPSEVIKHDFDIVFAGRLLQHKNVDVLLRSIHTLQQKGYTIKTAIIGNGPQKRKLERLASQLKLDKQVRFFNFFEKDEDLYGFIKDSKLFVNPSSREGFGLVALEANCCGIPVVTVNHQDNATKDLINSKLNGFICDLKETELAKAIQKGLTTMWSPSKIKESTRKFDWDSITKELEKAYLML